MAAHNGQPVKGVRWRVGVDYVDQNNFFRNVFMETGKSNRFGAFWFGMRYDLQDPMFEYLVNSGAWRVFA